MRRLMYVTYKKHHALRYFLVCLPVGTITLFCEVQVGNITGNDEFEDSDMKKVLAGKYNISDLPPSLFVCVWRRKQLAGKQIGSICPSRERRNLRRDRIKQPMTEGARRSNPAHPPGAR